MCLPQHADWLSHYWSLHAVLLPSVALKCSRIELLDYFDALVGLQLHDRYSQIVLNVRIGSIKWSIFPCANSIRKLSI
jgi:hypothetical protein